jgi:hypothetical protein
MLKDRLSVLQAIIDQGVIPVFHHPDLDVCAKVIQACADGGAKCVEFTNRGDFASHTFHQLALHFARRTPAWFSAWARSWMRRRRASTSPTAPDSWWGRC